jgi:hypothetical protein
MDSFIETMSSALLAWRLVRELRDESGDHARIERRVSGMAGGLLLLLAAYIVVDAGLRLLGYGGKPRPSVIGIITYGGGARSDAGAGLAQASHGTRTWQSSSPG